MAETKNFSENLPPELLPIVTYLPDLGSLDNLIKASPTVFGLFAIHGVEIFNKVLSSSSSFTHDYTLAIIPIIARVRSSTLPPEAHDSSSLRRLVIHETTPHRYTPPAWELPPLKILSAVPASISRGILATHQKIEVLTVDCLKLYLERFKTLKPCHLSNKTDNYMHREYGDGNHGQREIKPDEKHFPVRDTERGPSWVEKQRILRAFWRIQLFGDLLID